MATATYVAILERSPEGGLGISFPDFPGCVSATETDSVAEARAAATEALSLHIEGMIEDVGHLDFVGLLLVTIEAPKPSAVENERVNVILPKALLARIDNTVDRLGMNRSSFLAMAAREALRSDAGVPTDHMGFREASSDKFAHKALSRKNKRSRT